MSETRQEPKRPPLRKPRRGDRLEVEIESIDGKGRCVGTGMSLDVPESGSWVVSLRGGVPGERVRADVIRRRGNRVEARITETLRVSPEYFDMPEEMVATYQHYTCADMSQTQRGLGWSPNWSPTDAMVEYIKLISSERSNARVMPTA